MGGTHAAAAAGNGTANCAFGLLRTSFGAYLCCCGGATPPLPAPERTTVGRSAATWLLPVCRHVGAPVTCANFPSCSSRSQSSFVFSESSGPSFRNYSFLNTKSIILNAKSIYLNLKIGYLLAAMLHRAIPRATWLHADLSGEAAPLAVLNPRLRHDV